MDKDNKINTDFKTFIERLCQYYMEFLESDFKKRRSPSRKIAYRKKDLLVTTPLFKYDTLKKKITECINENFNSNKLVNITKDKFTIKLPEDVIEKINDDIEQIEFTDVQIEGIVQKVEKHIGKHFPDKEEFLNELRFEIKNLLDESDGKIEKEQVVKLLSDFVCYDFYDELYELWKNKTILEGEELYLYFYDIEFKDNRYPIFFIPIALNKRTLKINNEVKEVFDIEFGTQVLINKFAVEFISRAYNDLMEETRPLVHIPNRHLYLGDFDIHSEMQKMLNEICSFFKVDSLNLNYFHSQKVKNEHIKISNNYYAAICDKSDESLLNDFEELKDLLLRGKSSVLVDLFAKLSNDFLMENPKVYDSLIDGEYHEKELPEKLSYHSPISLNEEQQKIIAALRKPELKNIIVEGPPGTGKSHTITAIIFYALLEHKTILMTSDKKEALDVVENKISDTLDKVKKEDEFLQNPLLRLGKKQTNYSKIFKQQNYEKINSRYNASRRLSRPLNQEIEKCTSLIKKNIDNQIDVYSSVDLNIIRDISHKEDSIKNKFGKIIDFPEAYNNKEFVNFIQQIHNIIAEFQDKKELIDSLRENIDYDTLLKYEKKKVYKDSNNDLARLLMFIFDIKKIFLDVPKEKADYLKVLKDILSRLPSGQLVRLLELHNEIEKIFKSYQDSLGEMFKDFQEVRDNISDFDTLLEATKEICNLLKRLIQSYKDNFLKLKNRFELINDVNDDNVNEIEKYIKMVLNLKSKLFGIILKRSELKRINHEFLNKFPSWGIDKPHKRVIQLEKEYRFYKLFIDVRRNTGKYSNIDCDYFRWSNLEKLVTKLQNFDFDDAIEKIKN
ncbi:MAG: AAA domain-containing protein, partial [Candidatus Omnitrophota bacterium]